MQYVTPDLCDAYPELVQVVEPMFSNFGGHDSFGGEIVTIKCFEDNSLVKDQVDLDGKGKVLVVDGGGSLRRALLGDMLAEKAAKNGWEGLVVYGCIRDVDVIAQTANVVFRRLVDTRPSIISMLRFSLRERTLRLGNFCDVQ